MQVVCTSDSCEFVISSKCVFYEGAALPYTDIATNDTVETVIQKLDEAIQNGIGGGSVTSVTASLPLVSSGGDTPNISMPVATGATNGYLSATNWNTFNNKQDVISLTTLGTSGVATFAGNILNIPNYQVNSDDFWKTTGTSTITDGTIITIPYTAAPNSFILKGAEGINPDSPVELHVGHFDDGLDYGPFVTIIGYSSLLNNDYAELNVQASQVRITCNSSSTGQGLELIASDGGGGNPTMVFSDTRTVKVGVQYAGDYSADVTARTLIDKGTADGLYIQTVLTANTSITGAFNFEIGTAVSAVNNIRLDASSTVVIDSGSSVTISTVNVVLTTSSQVVLDTNNGISIRNSATPPGVGAAGENVVYTKDVASSSELFVMNEAGVETKLSGNKGNAGGTLNVDTTTVGNTGGGEDDLKLYNVPANTLSVDGQSLIAYCAGTYAANVNNKVIKLYLGSTVLFNSGSVADSGLSWLIRVEIIRTGASSQKCIVVFTHGATTDAIVYITAAETLSGALDLKITGESLASATNDVVSEMFTVRWEAEEI